MPKKLREGAGETLESYPMRVQTIRMKGCRPSFFVYIPVPLAALRGIGKGTVVSWELLSRRELHLEVAAPDAAIPDAAAARYPLRVQAIKTSTPNPRYFVNIPQPMGAPIGLVGGEEVSWRLVNGNELHLVRSNPTPSKALPAAPEQTPA